MYVMPEDGQHDLKHATRVDWTNKICCYWWQYVYQFLLSCL